MDDADRFKNRIAILVGGELQCCGSSLFLKRKYGAGYSLNITKKPGCHAEDITAFLKKFLENLQVLNYHILTANLYSKKYRFLKKQQANYATFYKHPSLKDSKKCSSTWK